MLVRRALRLLEQEAPEAEPEALRPPIMDKEIEIPKTPPEELPRSEKPVKKRKCNTQAQLKAMAKRREARIRQLRNLVRCSLGAPVLPTGMPMGTIGSSPVQRLSY